MYSRSKIHRHPDDMTSQEIIWRH